MSRHRVLVVDDEADLAEFVVDVAEAAGYDAAFTDDPNQFPLLFSRDIDIVILDLFMPGMDGIELLRFLADNRARAAVVFMSGKDQGVLNSASRIAAERGMTVLGTLQKPFRAQELETVLAGFVPQAAAVSAGSSAELPTLAELQEAIARRELYVAYQPQIRLADRRPVGVECFARWNHPTKGYIPPGCFIPMAEEGGLIGDLTSLILQTAILQAGAWHARGLELRLAVNISPKSLDHLEMPEQMAALVAQAGLARHQVMIEVTETALMADVARYMDILTRMRMKGFQLSIDDFGTGYSSLQQLVRVPFNELKIDQTFVRRLDADPECRTITEISILLAHKLGMHVVAEGIESEAVWTVLGELGCDEGQGFWMGRPMRAAELETWWHGWARGGDAAPDSQSIGGHSIGGNGGIAGGGPAG